jgi:hypothetical protein
MIGLTATEVFRDLFEMLAGKRAEGFFATSAARVF